MEQRSVAIIGGGITGLVAARRLAREGHRAIVFDAAPRPGGQVRTEIVAGMPVDIGAEALHLAGPPITELLDELGLAEAVVMARPGTAAIWDGRRLRSLPAGVGPAGPTRLGPVLSSRVLSPRGLARAAAEPFLPRRTAAGDDVAVGTLVAGRFGREVSDRLVDPVLGSLHAGDVSRLSARAATPQLAAQADQHRSLLVAQHRRRRARRGGPAPALSFASFRGGLVTLVDALAAAPGVEVRSSTPILDISPRPGGYRLRTVAGDVVDVEAVVLAVPYRTAASMLRPLSATASTQLEGMCSASVATVVAAYPRTATDAVPALRRTGMLVRSSAGRLLKAATFLSTKWEHLDHPEVALVRMSAGRAGSSTVAQLDDDELAARLHADLADATGLDSSPAYVHVQRWPHALAQLEVGHLERMEAVRDALGHHSRLVLAGASYDGLGLTSCISSGTRAAAAVQTSPAPHPNTEVR